MWITKLAFKVINNIIMNAKLEITTDGKRPPIQMKLLKSKFSMLNVLIRGLILSLWRYAVCLIVCKYRYGHSGRWTSGTGAHIVIDRLCCVLLLWCCRRS